MAKIEDTGKVWFPGKFSPEYAVRVENLILVPGRGENDAIHCRVNGNGLYVDLHDAKNGRRTARRFPLDLSPSTPAALFNGFEKTKHADVLVVTAKDNGVEEHSIGGEDYLRKSIASLDSESFWELLGFRISGD